MVNPLKISETDKRSLYERVKRNLMKSREKLLRYLFLDITKPVPFDDPRFNNPGEWPEFRQLIHNLSELDVSQSILKKLVISGVKGQVQRSDRIHLKDEGVRLDMLRANLLAVGDALLTDPRLDDLDKGDRAKLFDAVRKFKTAIENRFAERVVTKSIKRIKR